MGRLPALPRFALHFCRVATRLPARARCPFPAPLYLFCQHYWNLCCFKCLCKADPVWMQKSDQNPRKAKRHVRYCCAAQRHQIEGGRCLLHEHPWLARSWSLACSADLGKVPGVERARLGMCQCGMTSHWHTRWAKLGPVMKPMGMLSTHPISAESCVYAAHAIMSMATL